MFQVLVIGAGNKKKMDCLICQDFSSTRCLVVSVSCGDIVLAAATLKEMSTNKTRQISQEVDLNQAEEDE